MYNKTSHGQGLTGTLRSDAGEVISLSADVIHHIENPNNQTGYSLHLYGDDFNAAMEERSLWDDDNHEEKPFSSQGLIQESIKGMKQNNNQRGLETIVKAIPTTKALVDA